jgi:predicted O-methyltransferase YrrM
MLEKQFRFIKVMTHEHQRQHWCNAYSYSDGQALLDLAKTYKPGHILELGTALGYTACCLAAAGDNCYVDTIEADPEHVIIARDNIARAGLAGRVTVHEGDFTEVMQLLSDGYDIAFFDGLAPKPSLLLQLHGKLREGGVLICANVHFAGSGCEKLLNDRTYWMPAGQLEGGGTRVVVKLT